MKLTFMHPSNIVETLHQVRELEPIKQIEQYRDENLIDHWSKQFVDSFIFYLASSIDMLPRASISEQDKILLSKEKTAMPTVEKGFELSSPWIIYARKLYELFKDDPQIIMEYDPEDIKVIISVSKNEEKAQALSQLLPKEKEFGGVSLAIEVRLVEESTTLKPKLFRKAFEGNPVFKGLETVDDIFSNPVTYVVFDNKVVQYFSDNLGDINAVNSTLYEDIAREIFEDVNGVTFSTDVPTDRKIEVWP